MTIVGRNSISDEKAELKNIILNTVDDLCSDFLYYDRKEDETLSWQQLNNAVKTGIISINEIVSRFKQQIEATFNDDSQN